MLKNNKINDKHMEKVSGGITVDGHNYVKINKKDIEGYEYRCKTCGYVGYNSQALCPRCNAEGKYEKTGRFYMNYNKCNSSATNAYYYNS